MEKEPVYCPGCGNEMIACKEDNGECFVFWLFCPICGWVSPTDMGHTEQEAETAARATANQRLRPFQKPMTLDEVKEHIGYYETEKAHAAKNTRARPLYLDYSPSAESVIKGLEHGFYTFNPWVELEGILEHVHISQENPGWYGRLIRFWRDEPTPEEMAAAPWEVESNATRA